MSTIIWIAVEGIGTGSRLHENFEVVLRQNGVSIAYQLFEQPGTNGRFGFRVNDAIGATFEATVAIKSPYVDGPTSADGSWSRADAKTLVPFDLANVTQRFTLSRAGQPTAERMHPLVTFSPSLGTATSADLELLFHVGVLDVTSLYLAARQEDARNDLFVLLEDFIEEVDGKFCFKTDCFSGCTARLYSNHDGHTGWLLVPPSVGPDVSTVSVVYFLPERDKSYRDIFDVQLSSTSRYLLSSQCSTRMLGNQGTIPTLHPDRYRGFVRPAFKEDPITPLAVEDYDANTLTCACHLYPMLRLAEQLVASGKQAVLHLPIPRGDILPWSPKRRDRRAAPNHNYDWRAYERDRLALLQAQSLVGRADGDPVVTDKLVMAAHGAAGPWAIQRFDANREDFDELWLFDPDDLERWWPLLDRATSARIRLIGGESHTFMLTKMAALGDRAPADQVHTIPTNVGNITVWPRTAAFWARSNAYAKAYQPLEWSAERKRIEEVDVTLTQVARDLVEEALEFAPCTYWGFADPTSERLGLVEIPEHIDTRGVATLTIRGVLQNGAWTKPRTFFTVSPNEVVAVTTPIFGNQRASSEQQFEQAMDLLARGIPVRAREWTVFGWQALSDGADEREQDYKSYFELCLHFSGIAGG